MKCPKCLYIGFETGDRCKNCGYDFSLIAIAEDVPDPAPDLSIHLAMPGSGDPDLSTAFDDALAAPIVDRFRDAVMRDEPAMTLAPAVSIPEPVGESLPARTALALDTPAPAASAPALPLFAPDAADDEPLVKLPAVPRPPLSVRRTPDVPRLRPLAPQPARLEVDPVLQFSEEPEPVDVADPDDTDEPDDVEAREPHTPPAGGMAADDALGDAGPLGTRFVAALIDYGILLGIDATVLYFTLRLTELDLGEWHMLPWLPMAAFLLSLKVAYFSAFTTAGGQTIGKMATHLRVVSDDGGGLDAGRALRRALLGLASIATAGAPFLTALKDPARRAVHDRASGTRVVALSPR